MLKHFINWEHLWIRLVTLPSLPKAATEATNRMLDAYKHLQQERFKTYFRTLHSLAFNRLGMKKSSGYAR